MFCSFTCACISYDGSLKCCPGYYWNREENRCTSQFSRFYIYSKTFANVGSTRYSWFIMCMHISSRKYQRVQMHNLMLVQLGLVVKRHARTQIMEIVAYQTVSAARMIAIPLTVVVVCVMCYLNMLMTILILKF